MAITRYAGRPERYCSEAEGRTAVTLTPTGHYEAWAWLDHGPWPNWYAWGWFSFGEYRSLGKARRRAERALLRYTPEPGAKPEYGTEVV